MDILSFGRLFVLGLAQILFVAVNESPTEGKEMGELPQDKVYKGGRMDRTYKSRLFLAACLTWYTFTNIYYYGEDPLTFSEWILFLIMIIGVSLRLYCYWLLGSLFTFKLGIRDNHKLCQDGPYKYLIHPSYTGQIIFLLSYFSLLSVNIFLLIFFIGYIIYRLRTRMKEEEIMMKDEFAYRYEEYLDKRWRLIPYLY